ncbi:MAG: hypothetical protein ACI808_002398 [Paraglaciecola sp.]
MWRIRIFPCQRKFLQNFESSNHKLLFEFYADKELSDSLFSYEYILGLIFAVAAAPEIPMPEKWLIWVFKQRGQLSCEQQADKLTDVLMGLLQRQLKNMSDGKISLPADFQYPHEISPENHVSRWFAGLLAGHSQLENVWQQAWQKMGAQSAEQIFVLQRDLRHCLGLFSTFADIPLALQQAQDKGGSEHQTKLEGSLPKIFLSLPESLQTYVNLSGKLVDFLPNQFETFSKEIK